MQIGIIGTGMVGSAIAYSLASEGSAEKLILIDANKERAIAEAMDISHSTPFTFGARVVAGDYKDLKEPALSSLRPEPTKSREKPALTCWKRTSVSSKALSPKWSNTPRTRFWSSPPTRLTL